MRPVTQNTQVDVTTSNIAVILTMPHLFVEIPGRDIIGSLCEAKSLLLVYKGRVTIHLILDFPEPFSLNS